MSTDEVAQLKELVASLVTKLDKYKDDVDDLNTRVGDLEQTVESLSAKSSKVDRKFDESTAAVQLKLVSDSKLKPSGKRTAYQYLEFHATKVVEMKEFLLIDSSALATS